MREDIANLLQLQKLDCIRDDITARLRELPELIKEEEDKLAAHKEEIENGKTQLNEINIKLNKTEIDLKTAEDFIKKCNQQLNTLKSNEAYSKMQVEISGKKEESGIIEENILSLYDEIEQKQLQINKLNIHFEEKKKQVKEKQDEYRTKIEKLKNNKLEVEQKIHSAEEKIDNELLGLYKKIRKIRNGIALVKIEDSSCGGCYRELPPQIVNEVIKEEKIMRCENCNRFLYISDRAE